MTIFQSPFYYCNKKSTKKKKKKEKKKSRQYNTMIYLNCSPYVRSYSHNILTIVLSDFSYISQLFFKVNLVMAQGQKFWGDK